MPPQLSSDAPLRNVPAKQLAVPGTVSAELAEVTFFDRHLGDTGDGSD